MQTQENEVAVSVKGIDVGKIEKELASMWKSAGDEDGSNAESGVTRACALNLLVYANASEDRGSIDEMLDVVSEQHPGRTLVLLADREATAPALEAYVSTRCRILGGSGKQVCGEQVTIEAAGPAVDTAASAIAPLLVPDVPVFLWWRDIPHYEDKLFSHMTAMSDRLVLDSAFFDRPHEDLLRLAEILRARPGSISASDLNWGRLTAWRTLLASFWDVADYRPHLDRIETLEVEYDAPDAAPDELAPKALLMVGWLASRLGWAVEGAATRAQEVTTFRLGSSGRAVTVHMRATERTGHGDGMLVSLKLAASKPEAEFYVGYTDDRQKLETEARIDGRHAVGRILSYGVKTEGQRLSRELTLLKRDRIYEEALACAAQLVEAFRQAR